MSQLNQHLQSSKFVSLSPQSNILANCIIFHTIGFFVRPEWKKRLADHKKRRDKVDLKDLFIKKRLAPAAKRQLSKDLIAEEGISVSRACKLVLLRRSQYYYQSIKDDTEVIDALQELAFKHPSYGFRKLFAYIRCSDRVWNHKKYTGYIKT